MKTKVFLSLLLLATVVSGALAAADEAETKAHSRSDSVLDSPVEDPAVTNVLTNTAIVPDDPKQELHIARPLCTQDRAIPPPLQRRMVAENTSADVIELDRDHTPQLSMTNELVKALDRFANTDFDLARRVDSRTGHGSRQQTSGNSSAALVYPTRLRIAEEHGRHASCSRRNCVGLILQTLRAPEVALSTREHADHTFRSGSSPRLPSFVSHSAVTLDRMGAREGRPSVTE